MKESLRLIGWALGGVAWWAATGCAGSGQISARDASLTRDLPSDARSLSKAQQTVATAGDPAAPPDARRRAMARIATSTAAAEPVYLEFYRAVLADPDTDPTLASVCATALANHGPARDVAAILPLLESPESFTRWQAATALQRLHHPDAVGPLVARLADDQDPDTRAAAADALGQYPRRDVFDTLVIALDDPDTGVARAARQSLAQLTHAHVGDDPRAWLDLADERRDAGQPLFDPQPYTYTPYPPSRGWLGWVLFFLPPTQAQPVTPTGL